MKNKLQSIVIVFLTLLLLASSASAKEHVNIGIVLDGPWSRFQEDIETVRQEIIALTEGEFEVAFPEAMQVHGGWSAEAINRAIDGLLANKDTDALLETALPQFEKTLIQIAMARTNGSRKDAAQLLGWGRNTLTRKMKSLHLD